MVAFNFLNSNEKIRIPPYILINFKNSFLFLAPSLFTLLINLFTMPIFARNLSHYDYSIIGYFGAIQGIITPILNLSLFPYYMRHYHKRTDTENDDVIKNIVVFLAFANLVTIVTGTLIVYLYFYVAEVEFPLFPYIFFSFFSVYFLLFVSSLKMKYKMKRKGISYAFLGILCPILNITIGLFLVAELNLGAKGYMGAILLGQGLVGIYALITLYRNSPFDFKMIKDALILGYPLIIAAIMEFPILYLDRILLEQRNDIISFGLYSIGLMFAGYFVTVGSAIFQAFEPDFYKFIGKRQAKKTLLTAALVFGLLLFITILFNIFSSFIVSFLTSNRYPGAHKYADILIWANLLMLFSYFLAIYFVVAGKTKLLLLKQVILCILSVFFLYYAVVNWGFSGAAYARVFINLVNCLILVLFGGIIYWNMKQYSQRNGLNT